MGLGVRQLIKKPCSAESVAASVERTCRILPRSGIGYYRRSLIANTLHDVGVPANIKGYSYLIDALELTIANPEAVFSITQSIYVPIARQHGVQPEQVSHAITRAINIAWDRGDLDTLQSYFGYTVSNTRGMPTNGEFVAIIGETLRFQLDFQSTVQQ
jgi:two-component system response regulator (stage 0 sporulation protein A)